MTAIKELLNNRITLLLAFLLLFITACKEDDPAPDAGTQANIKVNSWIHENMEFWYLWNNQLPGNPDKSLDPESFFKSLLSAEDRFSWIQDNYEELLKSLQGVNKEAGYEFVLYKENQSSNNVIAQIMYIKAGSPAGQAGLKRGDIITHINDQQITTDNYKGLVEALKENHSIRYKPLVVGEERFDAEKTAALTTLEFSENPNFLSRVITIEDKKIGYYVYNFFASGVGSDDKSYDTEMENVFADFKAQGVTDLVLDLRYNSGGSETASNNLASHIGKGVDNTKVFARRAYNEKVEAEIINDPKYGTAFLTTKFANKASNIGGQLSGGRVYILTSSRTASASELIINSLKPFMDVFLIGDVTYGKNVGSISLYDDKDPANNWGLQPIVVKVYNSLDQSDYSTGFVPNVIDKDNSLYIYPLGDIKEALLGQAIGQITGTATTGRIAARKGLKEVIGHSLDNKRRSYKLIIDQDLPEFLTAQ